MKDGQYALLAGMSNNQNSEGRNLIPFFRIPFGSSSSSQSSQIIILLYVETNKDIAYLNDKGFSSPTGLEKHAD
jgi:hypothetical protein